MKIVTYFTLFLDSDLANFGFKVDLGMNTFGGDIEGLGGWFFLICVLIFNLWFS